MTPILQKYPFTGGALTGGALVGPLMLGVTFPALLPAMIVVAVTASAYVGYRTFPRGTRR